MWKQRKVTQLGDIQRREVRAPSNVDLLIEDFVAAVNNHVPQFVSNDVAITFWNGKGNTGVEISEGDRTVRIFAPRDNTLPVYISDTKENEGDLKIHHKTGLLESFHGGWVLSADSYGEQFIGTTTKPLKSEKPETSDGAGHMALRQFIQQVEFVC